LGQQTGFGMKKRIYLDYNASAPVLPAARDAFLAILETPGNASSVHREGQAQRRAIETARRNVAALVGAKSDNVVFTSGATESAASLLTPDWTMGRAPIRYDRLIIGATEHPCVKAGGQFAAEAISIAPVDKSGLIVLDVLEALLAKANAADERPLVAVQLANNETGVIQNISDIAQVVHIAGGFLIVDVAQAAGRMTFDIMALGADALILSSHKMGGIKGAGAIVYSGELLRPKPILIGGGQEKGFRAGTENAAAIGAFGAVCQPLNYAERARIKSLRDAFEAGLTSMLPDTVVHGHSGKRLDNTVFFSIPGIKAETAMIAFDLDGVAISSGSACSSGKVGRSAVLEAMGYDNPEGALRISFGPHNGADDLDAALAVIGKLDDRRIALYEN
jgi:cysteine desulfurase